ncbi:MAG: HD domain-containing phosphohydrolase [Chloroflexota bacterium]
MYLLIPIVEFVFCLALLALLAVSGQRHIARRPFTAFLVFMALWGAFIFLMRATPSLQIALFWEKFVFWAILGASLFFYRFALALTSARPRRLVLYPLYTGYVALLALLPTDLVVRGMQTLWYGKAPIIGPFFFLYVLGVYLPLILGLAALIRHYRQSRLIDERTRDQYVITGLIAMFVGGTTDYLPSLGFNIYPLGIVGDILFCLLATVAMLRYGLLDIKVVLRRGAAYSLISMVLFGGFGSLILLLSGVFREVVNPISLAITIVAVLVTAAVFQPFLNRVQRLVDRSFFRERYNHILALQRFSSDIKSDFDLGQLSSSLVTTVANGMESRGVYLLLPSPERERFVTSVSCGQRTEELSFLASSPLVVTMKYQDNLVDTNDMEGIPSLASLAAGERQTLMANEIELLVPLKNEKRLVGMLLLASKLSRQPYSHEERLLLKGVADDVAGHLENAGRYESMQREHHELQKAMEGVIYAISLVVETRDPYTAGHQKRVAELARAIAREMGLSEWCIKGLHIAGLLHDVGKIAVPAEILSKPGKLSQYEFSLIKNHSQVGCEILEKIEFPWPVTSVILQHHERLNGSGYPQGLGGKDILLEARILGVADVVEAMSSHRPYRPALGLDSALREITEHRDILYDADVVDACLRLLRVNAGEFDRLMSAAASRDYVTAGR